MTTLPMIAIVGASGRMGQMLIQAVLASDKAELSGVTERPGHEWVDVIWVFAWVALKTV